MDTEGTLLSMTWQLYRRGYASHIFLYALATLPSWIHKSRIHAMFCVITFVGSATSFVNPRAVILTIQIAENFPVQT